MYKFQFTPEISSPVMSNEFLKVHETRRKMIFTLLDKIIGDKWPEMNCLDVACNEGYYSFELAKRGAKKVIGFDAREINIQKANFVKSWFSYDNIEFFIEDINRIDTQKFEKFDIVFCLGLLYHLENPLLAMKKCREFTKNICVIDTQITRASMKISTGWGVTGNDRETVDSIAVLDEPYYKTDINSSTTGLSLVPNRSALITMLNHCGFSKIGFIEPYPDSYEQYINHDRVIIFAQ